MNTYTLQAAKSVVAVVVLLGLGAAPVAWATPPDDRVLPTEQYTSDKARRLATSHARALVELNATVYHCLPWIEVQKQSVGFFRPKGATQDDRYLSIRVYIEQDPSPEFANLKMEQRASAMFSRYVGPLLRRMAADKTLLTDASLDGFTIILEWLKQGPRAAADRPVHETIAVFVAKSAAADYLAGRASSGQLADGARVLGWDGETGLGQLRLAAWDDNFVATYKLANYEMDKGITCPR